MRCNLREKQIKVEKAGAKKMVIEVKAAHKEVLAWLIRASQLAKQALRNLNAGNPYDAVRLVNVIAKADANALNVITHVPNYETHVKPYYVELVKECSAIIALSKEALREVSPDLMKLPPEQIARVKAIFQEALEELDKELKDENLLNYRISRAEESFQEEKAWTYSRAHLESALDVLNSLTQDENAIKQTIQRFSIVFKGVKHPDTAGFVKGLIEKRLKVQAVVKFLLTNAYKSGFTFMEHDWHSELKKVSGLPAENIREIEALRQQLLKSIVFTKRNVDEAKIRQLLERVVALSQHATMVERTIEIAQEASKEAGKSDEEILKGHWEAKVRSGFVYHGTSSIFLQNIERFGLSSEQIFSEGTPFKPEDYEFFLEVSRKAYGADAPHLKYFTQDVTQGFFLDSNYNSAAGYARQGPERIRFMLGHIRDIENEFRRGQFSGRVSLQEVNRLLDILRKHEQAMSHHKPVVLHIPMSSPALLTVLNQNGLASAAELVISYQAYRQLVLAQLNAARTGGNNPNFAVPEARLAEILKNFDPLQGIFHNRPLKGTIPFSSIAKVEYV